MADTLTAYTTARARFERKASRASMPCASVRAGVTLPLELVGGGEPVPVGAGEGEQAVDRRHVDSIATSGAVVTTNAGSPGSHAFGGMETRR